MTDVMIWRCVDGHESAHTKAEMLYSLFEPRCERIIGHHGRTQNNKYAFPYYEGVPIRCNAALSVLVDVVQWPPSDDDDDDTEMTQDPYGNAT